MKSLLTDTRGGPASQIDFANAMAILMFGVVIFFTATTAAMGALQTDTASQELTAMRVSDKLVNDMFKRHAGDGGVAAICINDYFSDDQDISNGCEHDPSWADQSQNESVYLDRTLGYHGKNVNVTIRNQSKKIVETPQRLALGPKPPTRFGDGYTRYIHVDPGLFSENNPKWLTVRVVVW